MVRGRIEVMRGLFSHICLLKNEDAEKLTMDIGKLSFTEFSNMVDNAIKQNRIKTLQYLVDNIRGLKATQQDFLLKNLPLTHAAVSYPLWDQFCESYNPTPPHNRRIVLESLLNKKWSETERLDAESLYIEREFATWIIALAEKKFSPLKLSSLAGPQWQHLCRIISEELKVTQKKFEVLIALGKAEDIDLKTITFILKEAQKIESPRDKVNLLTGLNLVIEKFDEENYHSFLALINSLPEEASKNFLKNLKLMNDSTRVQSLIDTEKF